VEEWKKRDPIVLLRGQLEAAHLVDDASFAALEADVQQEIAEAEAFAEAGTWEPIEQLTRDVYTPPQEATGGRAGS
jgi:TPP-dependent pyruvate/acetoin dehydrogenase alpha subunit